MNGNDGTSHVINTMYKNKANEVVEKLLKRHHSFEIILIASNQKQVEFPIASFISKLQCCSVETPGACCDKVEVRGDVFSCSSFPRFPERCADHRPSSSNRKPQAACPEPSAWICCNQGDLDNAKTPAVMLSQLDSARKERRFCFNQNDRKIMTGNFLIAYVFHDTILSTLILLYLNFYSENFCD